MDKMEQATKLQVMDALRGVSPSEMESVEKYAVDIGGIVYPAKDAYRRVYQSLNDGEEPSGFLPQRATAFFKKKGFRTGEVTWT